MNDTWIGNEDGGLGVNSDTWIVLGSSISAPAMLGSAFTDYPDATFITTNAGIRLGGTRPDYYFLSDLGACKQYGEEAKRLQAEGMKIVTLKRNQSALKSRGLDHADILLALNHTGRPLDFARGEINDCMFSGLFCTQFAIESGAKLIAAVGHEGYPLGEHDKSYWRADATDMKWTKRVCHTKKYIAPWWNKVVAMCDDIIFHFYGDLNYEIAGPNVRRTPCYANQDA